MRSMKMARRVGIAPTSSGFGGPCIACLPPPYLENLRSTIQGHRDGHATTHSPQSQATICRPLCPWMADRPRLRGDLPIKNEHRCHARDGAVSLHRWRRTRRYFTADVSVFMAHLPGKPFGSVKLGQPPPRSSSWRRNFAYSMAVMVDIRVEGANLLSGHCLVSQNGSSRSLPGGLAPVSIAVDAGVFSCCEGMRRSGRGWVQKGRMMIEVGLDRKTKREKEEALLPWSGRAGLPSENWPLKARWAQIRPARDGVGLWRGSSRRPGRQASVLYHGH
jgi:hypothetical protein